MGQSLWSQDEHFCHVVCASDQGIFVWAF